MVLSTFALIPVAPMGWIYLVVALVGGIWFIVESHKLFNKAKSGANLNPMRLFHFSISYLTALFIAIGIDPLLFFAIY